MSSDSIRKSTSHDISPTTTPRVEDPSEIVKKRWSGTHFEIPKEPLAARLDMSNIQNRRRGGSFLVRNSE